jgi:hypothetical protein
MNTDHNTQMPTPLTEDQIRELYEQACRETFNGFDRFVFFTRSVERTQREMSV